MNTHGGKQKSDDELFQVHCAKIWHKWWQIVPPLVVRIVGMLRVRIDDGKRVDVRI